MSNLFCYSDVKMNLLLPLHQDRHSPDQNMEEHRQSLHLPSCFIHWFVVVPVIGGVDLSIRPAFEVWRQKYIDDNRTLSLVVHPVKNRARSYTT